MGVLMTPGDTALTRTPLPAYSMARARVTELSPPLGQGGDGRGHGRHRLFGQRRRDVDDVAGALPQHLGGRLLRDVEEPEQVQRDEGHQIVLGVVDEGLGDEDSGVVDQGVDAAEALHRCTDHALRSARSGDVSIDRQDARGGARLDGPGVGDNSVAAGEVPVHEACADPLGCAGDDDNLLLCFLFCAHDVSRFLKEGGVMGGKPPARHRVDGRRNRP